MFNLCEKDKRFEEILHKYFSKKVQRDEFRQFLWLQICENDHEKILQAWNERWFIAYYIGIINRQVKSKDSKWHKMYRRTMVMEYTSEVPDEIFIEDASKKAILKETKAIVEEALVFFSNKDSDFIMTAEIFRQYYFDNKSCRQVSVTKNNKLISRNTINLEVNRALTAIRWYVDKYKDGRN